MLYYGKFNILGVEITACDYDFLVKQIFKFKNKKKVFAPIASHPVVLAYYNNEFKKILNSFDYPLPDSQWVRWSLFFLYKICLPTRIYGPDLFLKICKKADLEKKTIYLIGNQIGLLKKKLGLNFPHLRIRGYDLKNKLLNNLIIEDINKDIKRQKIDIVLIGIGSPNQHYLAYSLKIKKPIVCIGAAFDFISGVKKQAPRWMGEMGLEWFWRMLNEPRLIKRYLYYGVLFVVLVLRQRLKRLL